MLTRVRDDRFTLILDEIGLDDFACNKLVTPLALCQASKGRKNEGYDC